MKLFGNKPKPNHAASGGKLKKGLLIALCAVIVIAAGLFIAAKLYVRPVGIKPAVQTAAPEKEKKPLPQEQVPLEEEEPTEVNVDVPASHLEGVYNVLVCGTDNDGTRTDTIIIAHLDTRTNTAALMSIPRDTVVKRGDYIAKINSVYGGKGKEGMERLRDTLEHMLGIPLDGYVLVNLEAFKKAVDLVGGVWYDVPQDMFYEDPTQDLHIDLKKGYQKLDGEHAMELVRFRKGYASQDIQRTAVQQEFLVTLAKQCMQTNDLAKLAGFAKIFYEDVTTDMDPGNLIYFLRQLGNVDLENVKTYTVQGAGAMINEGSYYPLYDWSILEIVNEAFNPYDTPITYDDIHVVTPDEAYTYNKKSEEEPAEQPTEEAPAEQSTEQTPAGQPAEEEQPFWNGSEWIYPTEPTQMPSDAVWQQPVNG